jgi:tetratricopeptide (TPR) repeat protein/O-antigen ligase
LLATSFAGDRFGWQVSGVAVGAVLFSAIGLYVLRRRGVTLWSSELPTHPIVFFLFVSSAVYTLFALDASHLTVRPTADQSDFVPGLFSDLKFYYLSVLAAVCAVLVALGSDRRQLLLIALAVQVVFLSPLYEPVLQDDIGALLMLGNALVLASWALADGPGLGLQSFRWTLVGLPVAAFLAAALLAVLPAEYVQRSLSVWSKLAALTTFVLLLINVVREERHFWLVGSALVLPVVGMAIQIFYKLVEIGNHMGIEYAVRYRYQFLGLVGANTAGLAISIAILIVVAGLFRTDRFRVRIGLALLLVPLLPILLSLRSASALVATGVVVLVPLIAANRELPGALRRMVSPPVVLAALAGVVAIGALIAIPNPYRSEWQDEFSDPTTGRGVRSNVWVWSVEDFQHNALLGIGPSDRRFEPRTEHVPEFTFRDVTSLGVRRELLGGSGTYWRLIVWGHPHNIFLLVAETTGVVGLATLLGLLGALMYIGLELTLGRMTSERWLATVAIAGIGACLAWAMFALGQNVAYFPLQTWPLLGLLGGAWLLVGPKGVLNSTVVQLPARFARFTAPAFCAAIAVAFLSLVGRPAIAEVAADSARDARQQNDVSEAIDRFELASSFDPLHADVERELAGMYARDGDLQRGLETLHRVTELQPGDAANYTALGWLQWLAGDRNAATVSFERSVELDPWNALASNNLLARGLAYGASDRGEAIASLEQAIFVDPTVINDPAWVVVEGGTGLDRAVDPAYLSSQSDERLRTLLQRRANLGPSAAAAFVRADDPSAIYLSEVLEAGYATYEATLPADRDRAVGQLEVLQRAALIAGMSDRAVEWAQQIVELEPEESHSHYQLGLAYVASGQDERAESEFREVIRIAEASAAYDVHKAFGHYQLGLMNQRPGDFEAAVGEFEETLDLYRWPYFPQVYLALSDAARQAGRNDKADQALDKLRYLLGPAYDAVVAEAREGLEDE